MAVVAMKPGRSHATSFLKSFKYAFEGIAECFRQGRNIRIQSCAAVVAVLLGFLLGISLVEWVVIIFCIGGVLGAECFNTSFEDVVDLACPEIHPKAKAAKDLAAAGVLVWSIASFIIGLIVFVPRLLAVAGW